MADFKSNKFLEQDSDVIDYYAVFKPILNPEVFTLHTPKDNITIRIEFENGNGFFINIVVNSQILSIKEVIQDMYNFPIEKQRLIYKNFSGTNGVSLKNDNYILDYNFLRDEIMLHLFILE